MSRSRRFDALGDRVVVVTGSSAGIGRETARLLARHRARVVLNGRNAQRLESARDSIAEDFPDRSDRIVAVAADVSTPDGARTLIQHSIARFGRIDALVNNAGVSMRGPIEKLASGTVEGLFQGNALVAVYPTVSAIPHLSETGGTVVFVSTAAALWGFPGVSWYSATKSALRTFAQSLDGEYRSVGIAVSTVFLDFVENDPGKETFAADGTRFVHSRGARLSQQRAAEYVVSAIVRPRRESYAGFAPRLLAFAARFAPRLLAYYLSRSGGTIHRVDATERHDDT